MILDDIIAKTKQDLEKKKLQYPMEWLGRSLAYNPYPPRDVKPYLVPTKEKPIRIIAEVKKASPSKGIIRQDFDPLQIAVSYANNGASAISVLTEPHFFKGNLEYLTWIRRYTNIPLLRKDFIIDEYQLLEALVYGADFVLLIAKALSLEELKNLYNRAMQFDLEVLVEIHDEQDLQKALECDAHIIGINHRNLETFEMDMELCYKLIPKIPKNKIIVAESGLYSHEQLVKLNQAGVDAFLIGEHFMRQDDTGKAIKQIIYPNE